MRTNEQMIGSVKNREETAWINPFRRPWAEMSEACAAMVSDEQIEDARQRLERFAPFIRRVWPETEKDGGLIESELRAIPDMQSALETVCGARLPGHLLIKLDSHLPIAGSIKARGGIYEVLVHAEEIALREKLIQPGESYARFADADIRAALGRYAVQVGSTGNLGLSIGIMSAALGFRVTVHMSADARQWKKDLLRRKGVTVVEYADDYAAAVAEGRKQSDADPMSYFVDDERSLHLFLGYAVAAERLKAQLDAQGIAVDQKHPLLVYLPAGVGGAPGGVAYGLKRLFGDDVHCFFCEPVDCPSVLLGMATQTFERCNVHDFGLSGNTLADGLACPSPSGFVTRIMTGLLAGDFTMADPRLYDLLRMLHDTERIDIEPSSCAAFAGPLQLLNNADAAAYCAENGLDAEKLAHATHIVWATGGLLVPQDVREQYLATYP